MGYKKLLVFGIFLITCFALLSSINAEIIISQTNADYNLGEELSSQIKLESLKTGYLDINLRCSNGIINLYHNVPEANTVSIKRKLISAYIGNLSGSCSLEAIYGNENKNSQNFNIENTLEVNLQIDEMTMEAGKNIIIKGTVYKKNNQLVGQVYPAFIEMKLNENISSSTSIKDGQFSVNFLIPKTARAGAYSLDVYAYEKNEEEILNNGKTFATITVTQKPAKISLALDQTKINPGENISLMGFVYDMAGDEISQQLIVSIEDSFANKIYETLTTSNELLIFQTNTTSLPGYSKVIIRYTNLTAEKSFLITEQKKLSAEIKDSKITITNIGNIVYTGPLEIQFAGENFVQEINLQYGESKVFDISAPDGVYDVNIKYGEETLSQNQVSLTGNVINVRESGERISDLFAKYPIVWIFICLVIFLLVWVFYKRYTQRKKLFIGNETRQQKIRVQEIKKKGGVEIINPGKVMERIASGEEIKKAEQLTTLQGQRQPVSIIALKIKNNIGGISEESISNALEYAYKQKAVSYGSGNSIVLIFSPLVTRKLNNEETAIKTALEIDNILKDHNRKYRNDLIKYGIGVNVGELINKVDEKVLQFTNMNKTITLAKKVAELAQNEVLLSKYIHEKTANVVKTDKVNSNSMDLFSVKRVVDNEKSQKFINEFLRRN